MGDRRQGRRGVHLAEILLALVIVGGPLLSVIGLVNRTQHNANKQRVLAAAEQVACEWLELVAGENPDTRRALAADGLDRYLGRKVRDRAKRLPPAARDAYLAQVLPLVQDARLEVAGSAEEAQRLELTVRCQTSGVIQLGCVVRAAAGS